MPLLRGRVPLLRKKPFLRPHSCNNQPFFSQITPFRPYIQVKSRSNGTQKVKNGLSRGSRSLERELWPLNPVLGLGFDSSLTQYVSHKKVFIKDLAPQFISSQFQNVRISPKARRCLVKTIFTKRRSI